MAFLLGPGDPSGKVFWLQVIALHLFTTGLGVYGVQVEPVGAWNHTVRFVQVTPQLVRVARLARIVAGDGQAATQFSVGRLETSYVVALPAM